MYAQTCVCVGIHLYMCMYICIYVYICKYTSLALYIYIYVYVYVGSTAPVAPASAYIVVSTVTQVPCWLLIKSSSCSVRAWDWLRDLFGTSSGKKPLLLSDSVSCMNTEQPSASSSQQQQPVQQHQQPGRTNLLGVVDFVAWQKEQLKGQTSEDRERWDFRLLVEADWQRAVSHAAPSTLADVWARAFGFSA